MNTSQPIRIASGRSVLHRDLCHFALRPVRQRAHFACVRLAETVEIQL